MTDRADRLAGLVNEAGIDALLVTDPVNVRYLTGFTGSNGACVVGPGARLFVTDFRYRERIETGLDGWDTRILTGDWIKALAASLEGRTGVEDHHVTVSSWNRLGEQVGEGVELVGSGRLVEGLRRSKDPNEIKAIAAAAELGDSILAEVLEDGLVGLSEAEVAGRIVARMREEGAEPSFLPIVASGPNGASPHAEPGPREIRVNELVTLDLGAELDGYCSDCTRTVSTGTPGDSEKEVYEVTLRANESALDAVMAGVSCSDLDRVARDLIDAAGYGEHFGHGLGHGVGMQVHEAPRIGPRSEEILGTDDVITIEPGIYVPGAFGVRIEDLVVVGEKGVEQNLSSHPKALIEVG